MSTHDELTETGIHKLAQAYEAGTARIVEHLTNVLKPATEVVRDYLAEGVR